MNRANACAGQHGNGQFRCHAHVDRHAIAFLDPERLQHVGEPLHLAMQLLVAKGTNFAGLTFPDQGSSVFAPGLHVAVETVVGNVDLPADEPFHRGRIPFEHAIPGFEPVQLASYAAPELLRLLDRLFINSLVLFQALDVSLLSKFRWSLKLPVLFTYGINAGSACCRVVGHRSSPWRVLAPNSGKLYCCWSSLSVMRGTDLILG